nr:hypothetical protein [Tanacetum cinerariifolium]
MSKERPPEPLDFFIWTVEPKTITPTSVTGNGFEEVTRIGKEQHTSKPRHIDGVRLIKQKLNYFYRPIGKSMNVQGEASTSQPKETVHTNTQPAANKDDVFETDKSDRQKSNNSESTVNDSDSDSGEVGNVL